MRWVFLDMNGCCLGIGREVGGFEGIGAVFAKSEKCIHTMGMS